jgi:hypothetical protein
LPVAGNLEREISANAYNRISSDIPDTKPETGNQQPITGTKPETSLAMQAFYINALVRGAYFPPSTEGKKPQLVDSGQWTVGSEQLIRSLSIH